MIKKIVLEINDLKDVFKSFHDFHPIMALTLKAGEYKNNDYEKDYFNSYINCRYCNLKIG